MERCLTIKKTIINLSHLADIPAIILFAIMFYYFHNKKNKNKIEFFLYGFSIIGLLCDSVFTFTYLFL